MIIKSFLKKNVKHFNNAIGLGPNLINFEDTVNKFEKFPIFLKIDIEGSEYRILDEILKNQNKFCGLVIEFHNADLNKKIIIEFIKNLKMNLVHIHGNNVGNKSFLDKNGNPTLIEMTFSTSNKSADNTLEIPHPLDQPANPDFEEIKLFFKDV